jgi:hypothetical protein
MQTSLQTSEVIHSGKNAIVTVNLDEFRTTGIPVSFRTEYGSLWHILLKFPSNVLVEDVVSVKRVYEQPRTKM